MSENEPNVRTIEEYLMLKLLELEEPQRPSDLLLAAWHSHPHVFGIAGYPTQHPDARHLQALATIRQEWLVQEEDRYALTKEGQVTALAIRDGIPLPKPIESRTEEEFYKLFDEHATIVKPKTLWEEYADQLRDGFIASANRFGFTIELADGDRTITFGDEGLTEKVYNYFAPLCKDDWDRGRWPRESSKIFFRRRCMNGITGMTSKPLGEPLQRGTPIIREEPTKTGFRIWLDV